MQRRLLPGRRGRVNQGECGIAVFHRPQSIGNAIRAATPAAEIAEILIVKNFHEKTNQITAQLHF